MTIYNHCSMADARVPMNIDFDSTALEMSLPDLTIGVRDGNLMYTQPEQIVNRRRCKCFERRSSRYYDVAVVLLKSKMHKAMPVASVRISKHVRKVNLLFRRKIESFFVPAPTA
ncbi:hypothetical protein H4R18_002549 [Coemansia javaensis]|uniref:Uncharacterized protein n=1 Tax=Coemansia javaensis TaxID=2761396 RepID=A0A9W8HGF1_9FUNG|nr:hypothetical protein H4R18_002549 [Coemansia javaensis]